MTEQVRKDVAHSFPAGYTMIKAKLLKNTLGIISYFSLNFKTSNLFYETNAAMHLLIDIHNCYGTKKATRSFRV
jgi:hypothetical protein